MFNHTSLSTDGEKSSTMKNLVSIYIVWRADNIEGNLPSMQLKIVWFNNVFTIHCWIPFSYHKIMHTGIQDDWIYVGY